SAATVDFCRSARPVLGAMPERSDSDTETPYGGAQEHPESSVTISLVSLTPANNMIRLDISDGSVDVLGKTSSGAFSLVYQICEIGMPSNCAPATVALNLSGR